MAPEQSPAPSKTPWTRIFSAFKIALDLKKLALAAVGIFTVWIGWWVLGFMFFGMRSYPVYIVIENQEAKDKKGPDAIKAEWDYFKAKRASWNLMYELAASPTPDDRKRYGKVDAGDVAENPEDYKDLSEWEQKYRRWTDDWVMLKDKILKADGQDYVLTPAPEDAAAFAKLPEQLPLRSITIVDPDKKQIKVDGLLATVDSKFDKLKEYRDSTADQAEIAQLARKLDPARADRLETLFAAYLQKPAYKKYGLLRISPWFEDRGDNPYLMVSDAVKSSGKSALPASQVLTWFYSYEVPVVLEPLFKFLTPLAYLFDNRASFWDRLYLVLVILWTLAIWGFFGGAICRIAAVQFARNERIPLKEAILFTKERFASYIAAPVFPLILVSIFVVLLMVFGWIEWIPWVGDLFAGLLWPVVILFGFIIAIVLVGMVGWPLMIATISTEGTDSFDALSRSYSYVYQAPWQYVWYSFLSVVYGGAVVFFIGFMASLMMFMGKWGVSSAVGLADSDPQYDREPAYLFYYAPTSFGWRDMLISSNARFVEEKTDIGYDGRRVTRLEFKPEYEKEMHANNSMGAFLVACWVYPLFLFVIGFGYSFFWSASTIIYFLMRHHVDDTDLEEVYLEDEEIEDPFLKQPPVAPTPPASKPGTVSLNVVEAPPPASYTAEVPPPPPPPINEPPPAPPPPVAEDAATPPHDNAPPGGAL